MENGRKSTGNKFTQYKEEEKEESKEKYFYVEKKGGKEKMHSAHRGFFNGQKIHDFRGLSTERRQSLTDTRSGTQM